LKDERRLLWGQVIDAVLFGGPGATRTPSLAYTWDRDAAEEALLERILRVPPDARPKLQSLFRQWGLFQWRLQKLLWGNPWQQGRSALVLAEMDFREAVPAIVALLERPYPDVRLAAVNALAILAVPGAVQSVVGLLPGGSGREARAVLAALIRCAQTDPNRLVPYLQHPFPLVRLVAAAALAELAGAEHAPALLEAVSDADPEVRSRVARALGHTGRPEVVAGLARLAVDSAWFVRLQAVASLGQIRTEPGRELLWKVVVEDADARVRRKAALALYEAVRDPVRLLKELRARADHAPLAGLVDELSRRGVAREAINRVNSPLELAREENRAFIRELLRAGFFEAVLYAIAAHPELPVRHALLDLVATDARPAVQPHLPALLASPALDPESRRRLEALLTQPEAGA